jgi:two-component system alkaline phosphatase synthesis response regulator PhoP
MRATVLVADDEAKIVSLVKSYLEASDYRVLCAKDGNEALRLLRAEKPDCAILDINMPFMDGLDVAREIRKESELPIIFLTARADETDRVVGLELGADDYVVKPFSPRELVARVKAVLRRYRRDPEAQGRREIGALSLDAPKRTAVKDGKEVSLTAIQFDILALLMGSPGKVWTRLQILEASFEATHEGYERTIDAHIKNIRRALGEDGEKPRFIETVRGVGYRFKDSQRED